ncbi:MAG: fibronectin type III domain-containing protein [Sphingobacteriaceae bacterium]
MFTFLLSILFTFNLIGQTYPVQISAQLVPPYSGYLPDYADPSAEKLKVILKFNDFSQPQYDIKLKFEIKGNGFSLSTKTFFNPPPITLIPGQPLLLSGNDLAPYLNASNLDFIGINQSQYQQRMSLPEGYYSICIKAYDYNNSTPIQLSNEACAQAWFTLSDPPYLNMPFCGSYLTPLNPQNIIFQWTPVNQGSPLSALNTEYEFALYECRPDSTANPNQIVLSTAPIYSITTQQTFINYGITEPPLNLYMKYVWRVRAKDVTGRDLFKNQGYSQICTFTYGTVKNVLGNSIGITLSANEINHRSGECTFNKQSIYSNYLLQVRKKGTLNWFNYPNTTGYERISNLEPSTTYECRVRGEQPMAGEWSNTAEFTTYAAPNYACNTNTMPVSPNAKQPLPVNKAVLGMIIQSGQFEVIATEIKSNNIPGWYRGKGYALVFGGFPVAVKWDNIFIDIDQRQQQGIIEAMTKGVEAWEHAHDLALAEETPIVFGGTIKSISIVGNQVCAMLEGNTTPSCVTLPENKNIVVVRDANGNQYEINMVPPPPTISGPKSYIPISSDTLSANANFKVVFEKSGTQKYGFDKRPEKSTSQDYEFIKLKDGSSYFVPYKSIGESGTDEVVASYSISNFDANKLEFKTMSGSLITKSTLGDQFKLTGIPDNATCVYAYYDNKKIGKLNVVSLKPISKKLVIVLVNGAAIASTVTAQEINKVYAQANVSWSVTTAPNFTFNIGEDGLQGADANLLTKYSAEMRALRDAYQQTHADYDKEAYYVFVVPKFNTTELRGYMVRGRALGFVANNASVKELTHELAHGAFALSHTFPKLEKGSTDNLLDYGEGVVLDHQQWLSISEEIHVWSWQDDEEDGALFGFDLEKYIKEKYGIQCYETYKDFDGVIPQCFWNNSMCNLTPEQCYGAALVCGVIDGVFVTIKDVFNMVEFVDCWSPISVNSKSPNCYLVREKTLQTINSIKEVCNSPNGTSQIFTSIKNSIGDWSTSTFCTDKTCAYKQGRLIFDVVSLFYGVGEVKAALKTGIVGAKIAQIISEVDKTGLILIKNLSKLSGSVEKTSAGIMLYIKLSTGNDFTLGTIDKLRKAIKFNNNEVSNNVTGKVIKKLDNITFIDGDNVSRGNIEIIEYVNPNNNQKVAGWKKVKNENIVYPSVKINGIPVVRIMTGTNNKIAIIGRKMPYVREVSQSLRKLGKEVEVFEPNSAFAGKGYNNLDKIYEDFEKMKEKFPNGIIPYNKLKETLWYKENERWANWIKDQGYEIYDLGDNPGQFINSLDRINVPNASAFYDMEKRSIFGDN